MKGGDPATMPIELPAILELIVNLKTARAPGVKVPQTVLIRAVRVIEQQIRQGRLLAYSVEKLSRNPFQSIFRGHQTITRGASVAPSAS